MEWDPELYVSRHSFVFDSGREALRLLAPRPGERILDLGCGTGQLTQAIATSGARVTGLDSSPAMIQAARRRYPHLSFVSGDATNFSFPDPFDGVYSNAAIHWMNPPEQAVACVARCLRTGGRLAAEFGGQGHLADLRSALEKTWREMTGRELEWKMYFPSVSEFTAVLKGCGLEVRQARMVDLRTRLEDGENGLRHFLTMFGGERLRAAPAPMREKLFRRAEELARPALFHDGSWYLDRRRLRLLAVKREG